MLSRFLHQFIFTQFIFTAFSFSTIYAQSPELLERPLRFERERTFDAIKYIINLDFNLERKTFEGFCTVSLTPLSSMFDSVYLDARELVVSRVVGEKNNILEFIQDEESVIVFMDRQYAADEELSITLFYKAENTSDGLFFDDESERYPKMVSSNSWPDHARYWFPCYDAPNDKAAQELFITVDKSLKVVSNGRLVDETDKWAGTR